MLTDHKTLLEMFYDQVCLLARTHTFSPHLRCIHCEAIQVESECPSTSSTVTTTVNIFSRIFDCQCSIVPPSSPFCIRNVELLRSAISGRKKTASSRLRWGRTKQPDYPIRDTVNLIRAFIRCSVVYTVLCRCQIFLMWTGVCTARTYSHAFLTSLLPHDAAT